MNPLETLSNEHGLIRHYLDNLALAAERIEKDQPISEAFFVKAIEFARTFADKYHHFKEEHVLFVRLAQKKKGEIDGQLEALRQQHERSRELVTTMQRSVDGYVAKDPMRTADLVQSMAAYGALLRHHIHTEDHIFFPAARNLLDASELDQVSSEFEKQREKHGADMFEKCHKMVVDMGSILTHMK